MQRQQLLNSSTNWPMYGNPKDPALKTEFKKKWLGQWAEGEDGQKPTVHLLLLHCASCSLRDTLKTNSSAFKDNICDPR